MTDYPIPTSAIEAAAKAAFDEDERGKTLWQNETEPGKEEYRASTRAALRAAFEELGMEREEYSDPSDLTRTTIRYVSRWMPVEGP